MKPFDKPPLTIDEQLQLLKNRGLTIQDEERASRFLEVVSLFRLSPYMRPYVSPDSLWKNRLEELLAKYANIPLNAMGFSENWKKHPIWDD